MVVVVCVFLVSKKIVVVLMCEIRQVGWEEVQVWKWM
jgi:hypothetical protein